MTMKQSGPTRYCQKALAPPERWVVLHHHAPIIIGSFSPAHWVVMCAKASLQQHDTTCAQRENRRRSSLLLNQIIPNEEQDVFLNEQYNLFNIIFPLCSDESQNNTDMNNNALSFTVIHDEQQIDGKNVCVCVCVCPQWLLPDYGVLSGGVVEKVQNCLHPFCPAQDIKKYFK